MGATRLVNAREEAIEEVQKDPGMAEGFDIGLEMSGSPQALGTMVDNMAHGGRIAILGIPSGPMNLNWNKVIFNMLVLKGIYGRRIC